MSTYLIGDIHGCFNELKILLSKVLFNPIKDTLWITGDLVARGPDSLKVLCFLKSLGKSIKLVLGNHDLHLIAAYFGIKNKKNKNYNNYLLNYLHSQELINWLCIQPFIQIDHEKKIIMSHAGITPQWDLQTAQNCALEIHLELSNNSKSFLNLVYEKKLYNTWNNKLKFSDRLTFSINALTKMRYCLFKDGSIEMNFKQLPKNAPLQIKPWFFLKRKISSTYNIVFGHWSCISDNYCLPENIYSLDTGCCWGGKLTLLRWEDKKFFTQNALKF